MNRTLALAVGLLAVLLFSGPGLTDERVGLVVEAQLGGNAEIIELRHRDAVRSGDGVRFQLESERSAYVYLLALGSSGKVVALQPFSGDAEDARLEGGERREIPQSGIFLPFDNNPGREVLFAFGADDASLNLPRLIDELSKLGTPETVKAALEKRYPRLVTLELQHLPSLLELKRPSTGGRAARSRGRAMPKVASSGLFKGSVIEEEPDVLSGEGQLIGRLLQNGPAERTATVVPIVSGSAGSEMSPASSSPSITASGDAEAERPGLLARLGNFFGSDESTTEAGQSPSGTASGELAFDERGMVLVVTPRGAGSGALVLDRRHVLTPWHLIDGQNEVSVHVRGDDGAPNLDAPLRARVIRHNVFTDLALLKLETPYPEGTPVSLPAAPTALEAGQQVHVLSHDDDRGWRRGLAIVVVTRAEHSWFSNERVIHRGPAVELQMSDPPRRDGALVLNAAGRLVGLKVRTGRRKDSILAVGLPAIRAFLGS